MEIAVRNVVSLSLTLHVSVYVLSAHAWQFSSRRFAWGQEHEAASACVPLVSVCLWAWIYVLCMCMYVGMWVYVGENVLKPQTVDCAPVTLWSCHAVPLDVCTWMCISYGVHTHICAPPWVGCSQCCFWMGTTTLPQILHCTSHAVLQTFWIDIHKRHTYRHKYIHTCQTHTCTWIHTHTHMQISQPVCWEENRPWICCRGACWQELCRVRQVKPSSNACLYQLCVWEPLLFNMSEDFLHKGTDRWCNHETADIVLVMYSYFYYSLSTFVLSLGH